MFLRSAYDSASTFVPKNFRTQFPFSFPRTTHFILGCLYGLTLYPSFMGGIIAICCYFSS